MLDRKGRFLEAGQTVIVPDPNKYTDTHGKAFIGHVVDVLESRGTAMVADECNEYFEVETDRLEINE